MKSSMIILKLLLLMMCSTVRARLGLCDIKTIEESSFVVGRLNLLINPDGPLNLLRGYLFHKSGVVYNKRFFSSAIDTDYSMKKSDRSTESTHIYTYTRNPENDKTYKENNAMRRLEYGSKYLSVLYKQMIYMFPCVNNTISIEPCRNDSFTRFLRVNNSGLDSMYLLAALLLLSEGIYIPIEIENSIEGSERILLKDWADTIVFLDLPLRLESTMPDGTIKKVYQKETEEVLRYFQSLFIEPFLSEVKKCEEPNNQRKFSRGYFLDSPKFLIQSYIFEYIDTIEQYRLFVAAVHILLTDSGLYPEKTEEQKELIKKTLNYCFIGGGVYKNNLNGYAADILSLKSKIDKDAILPFTCPEMVPSYTHVPEYDYIVLLLTRRMKDDLYQYSDHVETMLLNLFTCLTYNPETNKCSTEHMHGASTALREFFNKYSVPTESASQEKHRDWCRVVSRLNNPNIRYVRESRTELCGGLENILYVISELFSEGAFIRTVIEHIIGLLRNKEVGVERTKSVKELFLNVLKYLAGNHQIVIDSESLVYFSTEGQALDAFGNITVGFEANGKKESIKLDILPNYSKFSLVPEFNEISKDAEDELMCMQRKYCYTKKYIEVIILGYLNNNIARLKKESPEQNLSVLNSMLDKHELNKIFLSGRIDSVDYKAAIVNYFDINKGNIRNFNNNNQMLRIVTNIIGSVSLNNQEERKKILSPLVHFNTYKNCILKIQYDLESLPISEIDDNLLKTTVDMAYYKGIFYKTFSNLLEHSICRRKPAWIFGPYKSFRALCITLVERYDVFTLWEVMQEMQKHIEPNNAMSLNNIWLLWLSYACEETSYNLEIIDVIYRHLDPACIASGCVKWIAKMPGINFNYVLSILEKEKGSLYTEGSAKQKEKYEKVIALFKSIITSVASDLPLINPTTSRKRGHSENLE
ncbi:hypothetical protein NEPAR04_2051 [Nematocida parisii]|nr:hypothetical protein NEPAR03_2128 [Nematocida parisii]KAI5130571.1 hypothetical protein NEPAR08_2098 [Nematocida parisii]KAI5144074.1 hypothetical protein NEPAR04_2051 [Nematocida parisii]